MKSAFDIPAFESAASAAVGSLLTWYLTGIPLRGRSEEDKQKFKKYRQAAAVLGGLIPAANPVIRSGNFESPGAFAASMLGKTAASLPNPSPTLDVRDIFRPSIDVPSAFGIVQDDAFLTPFEKAPVLGVLKGSKRAGGKTSQYQLARTAVKAGAQFLPAYAFARLTGSVLGVPTKTAKRLSAAGALAYAVRSSGLLEEL